ncbi:LCP family protein [Micromonospora sp. NBC_01699]|uniref:LCP family protein n=1 Tax=Micromonospora sp. NBC_01699 TaxID=2975984 RepID=UPI002E2C5791|nr:LCP family protein [Micromonospora sp. NBC_01699]
MIEEELRAAFARQEALVPDTEPVRAAIDRIAVRRRRRRHTIRSAGAALAVLAVVAVPVVGRNLSATPTPAESLTGAPAAPVVVPDRALNVLLLGADGQPGSDTGYRADTVLIVHVPRDRGQVYFVSMPRDLGIDIPGHGFGKLNEAFHLGSTRPGGAVDLTAGARLTARTLTGLGAPAFDATAVLTFDGLRKLTDAVGGVRVCLPKRVPSQHTGRVFPAGCQRLDGAGALDLLRQRYGLPLGAHDRDRNAQRFGAALLAELTDAGTVTNPVRLSKILQTVGDGLATDTGGTSLVELLPVLAELAGAQTTGIGWEMSAAPSAGPVYQALDPVVSGSLFAALHADTLAEWVGRHPERITPR